MMHGIGEADQAADQAAIPEGDRDDAVAFLFAVQPLDQEAHAEHRLADKADGRSRARHRDAAAASAYRCARYRNPSYSSSTSVRAAMAPLQPAHAQQVVHADQQAAEIGVFRAARQARAGDSPARSATFQPSRCTSAIRIAVDVIEIGKLQKGVAAKCLQAAAGVGGAVVQQRACESRCPAARRGGGWRCPCA